MPGTGVAPTVPTGMSGSPSTSDTAPLTANSAPQTRPRCRSIATTPAANGIGRMKTG